MKKRLINIVFVLLISALAITSCGLFGGKKGDDSSPNSGDAVTEKFDQIVVSNMDIDILEVRSAIFDLKGIMSVVSQESDIREREIVFGDTNRPITAAAKAELSAIKATKSKADFGYIIYSDGKSIAVYWEHENLITFAFNDFLKVCVKEKSLKLKSGVAAADTYSKKEIDQDVVWKAIEQTVDKNLYQALRDFASEFDGTRYVEWLANLWDPVEGGIYFSNSARDYDGFLPDIESTVFCLSYLTGYGAMKDINAQLPNEIKIKIVDFFLARQDETDGYFYHPQWPWGKENLQVDRYGRDLSSAAYMVKFTVDRDGDGVEERVYPKVCTPNGYKCEEHSKNGGVCPHLAETALGKAELGNVTAAVSCVSESVVMPTASVSERPDFSSSEAFTAWLEAYNADIKYTPGKPSHYINAISSEIATRGYADEVMDYLDRIQKEVYEEQVGNGDTPSGLWSYDASLSLAQSLHKYMPAFYNDATHGRELKYYKEAISTCIDILLIEYGAAGGAMFDLMNQRTAINHVFDNVKKYHPEDVAELYAMVRERGVELVNMANENLEPNRLGDCMYSFSNGYAPASAYGVNVSLGISESDVNTLILVCGYYNAVFKVLNLPIVPLCTSDDGELFVDAVLSLEPIVKKKMPKTYAIDFEDTTLEELGSTVEIVKYNDLGSLEIKEDPLGEKGNVLSMYSPATGVSGATCNIAGTDNNGNCNIVEFDFYLASSNRHDGELYQMYIDFGIMFVIASNGENLRLDIISDGGPTPIRDVIFDYDAGVTLSEWHTIRLEAYDPDGDRSTPVTKVFVDDELMGESTIFFRSNQPNAVYDRSNELFRVYSRAHVTTLTYLDNVYCSRETKVYVEGGDDTSDLRDK